MVSALRWRSRLDRQRSASGSGKREEGGQEHDSADTICQRIPQNGFGNPVVLALKGRERWFDDELAVRARDRLFDFRRHCDGLEPVIERTVESAEGDSAEHSDRQQTRHRSNRIIDSGCQAGLMCWNRIDNRRCQRGDGNGHAESENRDR